MRNARRAILLLEILAALALLAILVALTVKMLSVWALERRGVERASVAEQEAANLVEQTAALRWDEITRERLEAIQVSSDVAAILPNGKANWTLTEIAAKPETKEPAAKRMRVEISWTTPSGNPSPPVRLNCWAFAPTAGGAR